MLLLHDQSSRHFSSFQEKKVLAGLIPSWNDERLEG